MLDSTHMLDAWPSPALARHFHRLTSFDMAQEKEWLQLARRQELVERNY